MRISIILVFYYLIVTATSKAELSSNYVVVGLDYGDIKAILKKHVHANIYIQRVARNPDGNALTVQYTTLTGETGAGQALIGVGGVVFTNGVGGSSVHDGVRRDSNDWVFLDGSRIPVARVSTMLCSPDGELLLLPSNGLGSSLISAKSANQILLTTNLDMSAKFLFNASNTVYVMGDSSKKEITTFKIAKINLLSKSVLFTDCDWIDHCYDMHPVTGQLLASARGHLSAAAYEYDCQSGFRKKIGLAREYMFYVRREFADKLRKLCDKTAVQESANFKSR